MKTLVITGMCCVAVLVMPSDGTSVYEEGVPAETCTTDVCKLEEGCRCATSYSPLQSGEISPQLISLTFDESVTDNVVYNFWYPLLLNRANPDGQSIGTTIFVPHEYTNYQRVNDLYNHGFEIGVNSVSKSVLPVYWRDASEKTLEEEFGGQKQILTKFANIPAKDILGARTPRLQLAANYTIQAYEVAGLSYDSSWPTSLDEPLFPYTLDYLSSQRCLLGSKCPNESFKGFWILPINSLLGEDRECTTLVSCNISGTEEEVANWLLKEIEAVRTSTRVPLTLLIQSYWFEFLETSFGGLNKFLDKLANYSDVFLVTQKQVLDWMKNPVPLSQFKTNLSERNATCSPYSCKLKNLNGDDRFMDSCVPCPANYPWLGNPEGN